VLELLGTGGMGAVYAAFDPELDRRIALKLLHGSSGGAQGSGGQQTALLREAQAMARLSHPNVVAVHDAGTFRERVFVAMELVDGDTLSRWLAQSLRSTREIVAVMRQAGRGLAAAHVAGLVHRDFKAENVMIDREGRVRVMDFGLARPSAEPSPTLAGSTASGQRGSVTQAGAMVGTPAYMAPEQFRGEPADDRSDQFAFAVTLYEALYGARPFTGTSLLELAASVLEGRRTPPPRGRDVPAWLRRILDRALSVDRSGRYPSMNALLVELAKDPTRARIRYAAVTTVAAILVGGAGWQELDETRRAAQCEAEGARVDEVWGASAKERVHASVLATGEPYAETTWERVVPWLDDYAEAWRAATVAVCSDEDPLRADLSARSMHCLEERRIALAGVVDRLAHADARAVQNAARSAAGLPPLAACSEERWLLQRVPAPAGEAGEAVDALRRRLADARALDSAGRQDEALAQARSVLQEARDLEWQPLVAEAELHVGITQHRSGDLEGSERSLRAAYFDAGAAGADDTLADASTRLAFVVGIARARFDDGLEWAAQAEMMLERLGDTEGLRAAKLADSRGGIHQARGDLDAAIAEHERALKIRQQTLGADHPGLSVSLVNLGSAYSTRGENDRALGYLQRALAIDEAAIGPDHPDLARVLINLAVVQSIRGALEEAQMHASRAVALQERSFGAEHPELAPTLGNLGNIAIVRGDHDAAAGYYQRALALQEVALGPEHPDVAGTVANLASVDLTRGDLDTAGDRFARALTIWEKHLDADHPVVGYALAGLGRVRVEQARHRDAVALLERALAIRERGPSQPEDLAGTRFDLARALWDGAGDRPRARALAETARDFFRDAGEARKSAHDEVADWLTARSE
jgi:tetratricopeptide (TPR) repeat protein